jgi:uncharacterized RDD family membrane protein YckC
MAGAPAADPVHVNAISPLKTQVSGPSLDNRRAAAAVIDLLVIGAGGALIAALAGSFTASVAAVTIGWALFYYFACESAAGQTLGKRLLRLRVERAGGGTADERAIAMRTVLRLVDGIGLYLVGLVTMLVSGERRQRLGDLAGGTVVASADGAPGLPLGRPEPAAEPAAQEAEASEEPDASQEPEPEPVAAEPEVFEPEPPPQERPIVTEVEPAAEAVDPDPEPEPDLEEAAGLPDLPPAASSEGESAGGPRVASPALEELAEDVAATAGAKPQPEKDAAPAASAEETKPAAEEAPQPESFTVKPVETVSEIDLVMSQAAEDSGDEDERARDTARSRGGSA